MGIELIILFGALVFVTWARRGLVRSDAGGAVYRTAAIVEGALLERDVLNPYRPLVFLAVPWPCRIFGPHPSVVYVAGLVLLVGQSRLLWHVAGRPLYHYWRWG